MPPRKFIVRKGFSIIELITVLTIFGLLSTYVISNFHRNQLYENARAAAQELAQRIRLAQSLSTENATQSVCSDDGLLCGAGSCCDSSCGSSNCQSKPLTAYGIVFNTNGNNNQYIIFADSGIGSTGAYAAGEAVPNGIFTLPKGVVFSSVPASTTITFSSTASAFGACSSCATTITLATTDDDVTKSVIYRQATGAITVQ